MCVEVFNLDNFRRQNSHITDKSDSNRWRTIDVSPVGLITCLNMLNNCLMDFLNINEHQIQNCWCIENGLWWISLDFVRFPYVSPIRWGVTGSWGVCGESWEHCGLSMWACGHVALLCIWMCIISGMLSRVTTVVVVVWPRGEVCFLGVCLTAIQITRRTKLPRTGARLSSRLAFSWSCHHCESGLTCTGLPAGHVSHLECLRSRLRVYCR